MIRSASKSSTRSASPSTLWNRDCREQKRPQWRSSPRERCG